MFPKCTPVMGAWEGPFPHEKRPAGTSALGAPTAPAMCRGVTQHLSWADIHRLVGLIGASRLQNRGRRRSRSLPPATGDNELSHVPGSRGPIPTAVSRAGAASSSVTTRSPFLYWWARQIAVRAEDAAIPRLRLEQRAAALAFIKELAGIRWHRLRRLMAARWAGDRRDELHFNAPERA